MHLLAPVKSDSTLQTNIFERYSLTNNQSMTYMVGDSMSSQNAIICAAKCTENKECQGMVYDDQTKRCFLKECVNPNLFAEWKGNDSLYSIHILEKILVPPKTSLARGNSESVFRTLVYICLHT